MDSVRVRPRKTDASVSVTAQEENRIKNYVAAQPANHWDSPAGRTVKELLDSLTGDAPEPVPVPAPVIPPL